MIINWVDYIWEHDNCKLYARRRKISFNRKSQRILEHAYKLNDSNYALNEERGQLQPDLEEKLSSHTLIGFFND